MDFLLSSGVGVDYKLKKMQVCIYKCWEYPGPQEEMSHKEQWVPLTDRSDLLLSPVHLMLKLDSLCDLVDSWCDFEGALQFMKDFPLRMDSSSSQESGSVF